MCVQAGVNILDGMLVKYGATMVGYAVCAIPVFSAKSIAAQRGMPEAEVVAVCSLFHNSYCND